MCSLREFCVFDSHAWKRVRGQKMALRDPLVPKNIEDPKINLKTFGWKIYISLRLRYQKSKTNKHIKNEKYVNEEF